MRVPLIGESFTLYSLASAAQESANCYPEVKDDPFEKAKGTAIIRYAPGQHLLKTLAHGNVRGMWSGGGRLFVVSGSWIYEVAQGAYPGTPGGGTIVSSFNTTINDTLPAQFFGNGNQLALVVNGGVLVNNGAGWAAAYFQISGTVSAVGAALTWVSGDKFTAVMVGLAIFVDNHIVTVLSYTDSTHITLTAALGGGAGTGYMAFFGDFTWASGDTFPYTLAGAPIVINAISYVVESVISPYVIKLSNPTNAVFPVGGPWAFNSVSPNLPYSAAAGDPVTAVTGAYLDGSLYVQRPNGGTPDLGRQVNFSGVNDFTIWYGLDFFQKEGGPDYIQSIISDHELLYVFGTEESEVWQTDKTSGRPVRLDGAAAREGLAAAYSPASMSETIYFVGGSPRGGPVAYRLRGFTPERISTHAVEDWWAKNAVMVPTGTDGVSYSYIDGGHKFWVVCCAAGAWVYDETASQQVGSPQWHQRASGGPTGPYRWWTHTYIPEWGAHGMHIVGDTLSGDLCEMNSTFADEEGTTITWRRALPYRWNGSKRLFFGRMDLEMDTGLVASGAEPVVTRDYSDDRGNTFVNSQTAGIGVHADFSRRVFWPTGGSSRGRVWRISGPAQANGALVDLNCEDADGAV